MKTLKFKKHLSEKILDGTKTVTWRLFDDKNITAGDIIKFIITETLEEFATAKITKVRILRFRDLSDEDWKEHKGSSSDKEMYARFTEYYHRPVDENTELKIVNFEIERK